MKKHTTSPTLLLAATLTLSASARPALAQSGAETSAQKAFDEGMSLMAQGKTAEACPKLAESQLLDPAMGTQFRLAECWEKLGRTASAWSLFRQVVNEAQATGRDGRASVAIARAAALEPRLTRIIILVAPSARGPGLVVRRDGVVVDESLWGRGIAVDPGDHVISASAPGKKSWEAHQQARLGIVEVTIPMLAPDAGVEPSEAPSPPSPDRPATSPGSQRSLVPGLVLSGAALAGLGTGVAFVVAANNAKASAANSRSELQRQGSNCLTPSLACDDLARQANAYRTYSNAALWTLLGSGIAAGGAVAYLLWPTSKPAESSGAVVHFFPDAGAGRLGFTVTGAF